MVDRAAPHVVGRYLSGRSKEPLYKLAGAPEPVWRRTAITAPLYYARYGSAGDLAECFEIAALLCGDPEPVVHNTVGIFLKHAGTSDPEFLRRFLAVQAKSMPRPALRLAIEKLSQADRKLYLA